LQRTAGPALAIRKSAFSADGKSLVILGADRQGQEARLVLWDVLAEKEGPAPATDVAKASTIALTPDGRTLAVAASSNQGSTINLWDLKTRQNIQQLSDDDVAAKLLVFSPSGRALASSGSRGRICLWDVATGRQLWAGAGHGDSLSAIAFSPAGTTIASSAVAEKTIRFWDAATGRELRVWKCEFGSACLAFSPTGKTLASGDAFSNFASGHCPVRLWDVSTGTELRRLTGNLFGVDGVAFSRDGSKLASGGLVTALRIYDTATGKELFQAEAHESLVTSVAFSPDSKTVATGGFDGTMRLWEAATGKPLCLFAEGHQRTVASVAFSPDGRVLASSNTGDGTVRLWEPGSGRITGRLANKKGVSIAYAPNGRTLVAAEGGIARAEYALHFWDTATLKERNPPAGMTGLIGAHSFSADGRLLATMAQQMQGGQSSLSVWDLETRKEIGRWSVRPIATNPALSPNGALLAAAESLDKRLHIMDVARGKDCSFVLDADPRPSSLAFSPDNRILAIGTGDGTVALWEVAAGQVRRRLRGHLSMVSSLSFSRDGRMLVSGSHDSTALVWDMTSLPGKEGLPPQVLSQELLQTLWNALAKEDAGRAYEAMLTLRSSPEQALPFLRKELQPQPAADPQRLVQLIAELDNPRFAMRQKALRELQDFGERAEPELIKAMERKPSAEVRQRIEQLLTKVQTPVAATALLQSLRAVEVLEQIGLPEAKQILQTLAAGGADNRLTKEAAAALSRLAKRPEKPHAIAG
jgi:WD40 repeat protein